MIRARLSNGDFLFGLDAENLRRLKKGEPIVVDLGELGGAGRVLITYGDTLSEIVDEIESITGQKLPPPINLTNRKQ